MHFEIDLPLQNMTNTTTDQVLHYSNTTGYAFLKDTSISIGEKIIDKHDGRFYDILNELRHENGGLDYLINRNEADNETINKPNATKMFTP